MARVSTDLMVQDLTWIACLVQTAFHIFTVVTMVLVLRRMNGKKKIEKVRMSQAAENLYGKGYVSKVDRQPKFWRKYMPLGKS
jgi:hypothetical protein